MVPVPRIHVYIYTYVCLYISVNVNMYVHTSCANANTNAYASTLLNFMVCSAHCGKRLGPQRGSRWPCSHWPCSPGAWQHSGPRSQCGRAFIGLGHPGVSSISGFQGQLFRFSGEVSKALVDPSLIPLYDMLATACANKFLDDVLHTCTQQDVDNI